MFKVNRILVPVDFSKESELALEWAGMMAEKEKDCLVELFHVISIIPDPGALGLGGLDYRTVEEDAIMERLASWRQKLPKTVMSTSDCQIGAVAETIAKACQDKAIDLVIMTTHGRKGLSHFIQGSVAEDTVHLAPCPVLVLHLNPVTMETVHAQNVAGTTL